MYKRPKVIGLFPGPCASGSYMHRAIKKSECLRCRWIRIERSLDILVNHNFSMIPARPRDPRTSQRAGGQSDPIFWAASRYARTSQTRGRSDPKYLRLPSFNLGKKKKQKLLGDSNLGRGGANATSILSSNHVGRPQVVSNFMLNNFCTLV